MRDDRNPDGVPWDAGYLMGDLIGEPQGDETDEEIDAEIDALEAQIAERMTR